MPLYNILKRGMRLPRLGTIRKGAQVPVIDKETGKPKLNKNREAIMRPVERPYWVIHTDAGDDEGSLAAIYQAYGTNEIKTLNVYLLYPDADANFSAWMEAYTSGQLVARSDERIITYLSDTTNGQTLIQDGKLVAVPKNPRSPAAGLVEGLSVGSELYYSEDMIVALSAGSDTPIVFKAVGRLSVVIQELRRPDRWFSVITGSYWYDIPFLYTALDKVKEIARYSGRPANTIPLLLKRVPVDTSYTDDSGKKHRKEMHCIQLEVRDDVIRGLMEAYENTPFSFQLTARPQLPERAGGTLLESSYGDESFDEPDEIVSDDSWEEEAEALEAQAEKPKPANDHAGKLKPREVSIPVISAKFLIDEQIAKNKKEADYLISLLLIDGADVKEGKARINLFNQWRGVKPHKDEATRKWCAEKAIAGEVPNEPIEETERPF